MILFFNVNCIVGRILVGLRWWNYVDSEGKSHWIYEARKVQQVQYSADSLCGVESHSICN